MRRSTPLALAVFCAALVLSSVPAWAQPTVIPLPPPGPTAWAPTGCRTVAAEDPVLASRESWRFMHGDSSSTDEISRAVGPMIIEDSTAEAATYNPTGPVFDDAGNVYVYSSAPYENVVLISLDPSDGSLFKATAKD